MRLGIVSDMHGNVDAMRTALDDLVDRADELLVAGDAFSDHRFSNDVVGLVRSSDARYVLGNHELALLSPAGVNARTSPRVDVSLLEFVARTPLQLRVKLGSKSLLMVHGSPWEPYGDYLMPNNPKYKRCDELDADFVVTGHTHTAFTARFGRTLVVNPGSLGKSDDPARRTSVTYSILDTDSDEVTLCELPNPLLVPEEPVEIRGTTS
jgi:putative phosphoesterase